MFLLGQHSLFLLELSGSRGRGGWDFVSTRPLSLMFTASGLSTVQATVSPQKWPFKATFMWSEMSDVWKKYDPRSCCWLVIQVGTAWGCSSHKTNSCCVTHSQNEKWLICRGQYWVPFYSLFTPSPFQTSLKNISLININMQMTQNYRKLHLHLISVKSPEKPQHVLLMWKSGWTKTNSNLMMKTKTSFWS